MTFTQKSITSGWNLLIFFFFVSSGALFSQAPCNCTNCPQFMPDGFTGSFFLNVQNACNPTLGQNGQGVCGVRLHLEHEYIGDLRITLTSPSGQTITLIGPVGFFGGTDFTDWDITFLPCTATAVPDPGFSATWNNNQAWGLNGNYSGSYYPSIGCLNTLTGPVNGQWTLTVFDQQAIDVGTFFDYEIIFCDPSCIDCFTCAANAGALPQPDVTACQGAATLNLNLPPTYTAQSPAPPASDYDYTYVVSRNPSGVIVGYDSDANLSSFLPGSYTVCGLSYLAGEEPLFPAPNGSLTTAQLLAQLASSSPPFCGRITSNCVNVIINPGVQDIVVSKDLCAPQCTTFYGTTYCNSGTYVKNLTQNGCPYKATLILNVTQPITINVRDTICEGNCSTEPGFPPNICSPGIYTRILPTSQPDQCDTTIRLTVVQVVTNVVIPPPPQITCTQPTVTLTSTGSSPGTYLWSASNGGNITSGTSGSTAVVNEPGTYKLKVCRPNPSGASCCDSATVVVTEVVSSLTPPTSIVGQNPICSGINTAYSTPAVVGATSYTWTFPPGVVINSGGTTNIVNVTWNNTTGGNVCVVASNNCGSTAPFCIPVTVNPAVTATQPQGSAAVCGNTNATYSIPANPNANSYNWIVTGGTISSGQGTNSINVLWGTGATGNVCVNVVGPCGPSPNVCLPVQISNVPAMPFVAGSGVACASGTGTYNVTPVNGATSYNWVVTNGTITSGNNTATVQVTWNAGATSGSVCASAVNACGASTQNCFNVTLNAAPPQPVITGDASICSGTNGFYSISSIPGATGYVWTVTGGTIVSGQNTLNLNVNWGNGTSGTVCVAALSTCGTGPQACFPVVINAAVTATQPQGSATVCGNTSNNYTIPANPNVTSYNWTITGGTISSGQGTNNISVLWGSGATGNVCVNVTSTCGTSPNVCLPITINNVPAVPVVDGNAVNCAGGTGTYTVAPVSGATSYNWVVTNGTITSGNNTTTVQVTWNAGATSGSICASSVNTCGSSSQNCFNVTLNAPPPQPVITGDATLCTGTNGNYSFPAIAGTTGYLWTVTGGTIVSGQNSTSLVVDWGAGTGGTVCAAALSSCGTGPQTCFPVVVNAIPVANAGSTAPTCALTINLQATNSVTGSTGAWTTVSGTGTVDFANANSPTSSVTVSQPGAYVFMWTESNGNCTDDATVTINFNPNPTIGQVSTLCEGTNQNYTVTFQPMGGTPPYTIPGGTITGGIFTSDLIASGQTYTFVVTDANGCASAATTGSFNCNCTSAAGQMSLQTVPACEGGTVTAQHLGGQNLDLNDVSSYILHTNSGTTLGAILAQNTTGTFSLQPGMTYETTYYVSFVVGNNLNGVPNPTDQCLSVAQGQPVIFHQTPVVNAGADDEICGLGIALNGTGGTGTWSVSSAPANGTITFADIQSNTSQITGSEYGAYTLVWTLDNSGCTASDQVDITLNPSPVAGTVTPTCDAANENYTITIPISGGETPYSVNGVALVGNTFVSTAIANGQTYSFTITDNNGCEAPVLNGSFNCTCTSAAGQMSLEPLSACGAASITADHLGGQTLDGNDVSAFVLHTNSGASLGTVIAQNATGIFSFQAGMTYGTTYYVSFVVGNSLNGFPNPTDPCLSVAQGQPVVFYQNPVANAGSDDAVCGSILSLAGGGTGNGQWTVTTSPAGGSLVIADPQDPATSLTASLSGQYTLTWTLEQNGCTNTDQVVVTFNNNPNLADLLRVCDPANENYTVQITITGGTPPYTVNSTTIGDSVFISAPITNAAGYQYTITDVNNCTMPDITGSFSCSCATDAGSMSAATLTACNGTTVTAVGNNDTSLDGNDVISYVLHNGTGQALGNIYAQNTTGIFGIQPGMNLGVTYYISRVAGNPINGFPNPQDPCFSVAPGQPVVFLEIPAPNAGTDAEICGLSFDLNAITSGFNGTWTQTGGIGTGTFASTVSAGSNVTVTEFGIYSFQWEEVNGICSTTDEVQITFNESPSVNAIDETCNGTNTQYTVTFSATGGVAPYSATGIAGTFSGSDFSSIALPNNSVYSFTVADANGCESPNITGIKNCNCLTNAGTMVTAPLAFCADQPATVTWNDDASTDADDIVLFILHNQSGSSVGTVYATSDQPSFTFETGLQLGTTYYISAIAGNNVGGAISLSDPCLSVALGTPVQWRPLPTATLSGDATICEGSSTPLVFSGTGSYPLTVTYSDGSANYSTVTISNQQDVPLSVSPVATTTYSLISVSSGSNPVCTTDLNTSVTVTLNQALTAGTANEPVEFCVGTALPVQLINLLTGADPGGQWTEISTVPSSAGGFNAQTGTFFTNGQQAGIYRFRYTRSSPAPCPSDEAVVQIVLNPLPVADAGEDKALNCTQITTTLGGLNTSSGAGIAYAWDKDGGTAIGDTRNLLTSEAGAYTLVVTNNAGCSASDIAIVTLDNAIPFADVITIKDVRCWGDKNGSISVDSFTTTHPPVLFSLNGGPFTSQTLYTALLPGAYRLTLQDANGCEWTADSLVVVEPPQLMLELGTSITVALGDSVHLEALINVPFAFLDTLYWNPVMDTAKAGTLLQDFLPFTSNYIDLRIIDTNGCATSDRTLVVVNQERHVYIPNIIKIGSAENDVLTVFGGRDVAEVELFQVYDRWGDQMFKEGPFMPNDVTKGWRGRFNGKDVNPGVFIYTAVVRFIDGERILFKGDVTVFK